MKRCKECKTPDDELSDFFNDDCEQCWHRWHNRNYGEDCCGMGAAPKLEEVQDEAQAIQQK